MITTVRSQNKFLVECHIPLNFIKRSPLKYALEKGEYGLAFQEWSDGIHGKKLIPDARRYGKVNNGPLKFWVESVGSLYYGHQYSFYLRDASSFEMTICLSAVDNVVWDTLHGKYGNHFFLINVELDEKSTPESVKVKRFLTPVLMAKYYEGYEYAMDNLFSDLIPYFDAPPDPYQLPHSALRY